MDLSARLPSRLVRDERGVALFRYGVIIALAFLVCFLAFTTVGQDFAERVWALGDKIADA
jgi:Flp pilus assembly pilin Flp